MPTQTWQDMIDVNLTGVWHTVKAGDPAPDRRRRRLDHPHQLDRRAARAWPNIAHYVRPSTASSG